MRKFGKILGFAVAALFALVVVLLVLIKILVTPERVRETVLPAAREALNREVSVGDIEISLFSGISLENLVIQEREGAGPFVAAERIVLRYRLWPLLLGRVVIGEARLEQPKIQIVRQADGTFNFSDLTKGADEEASKGEGETTGEKGSSRGTPIDLLISEVSISKGEFIFLDYALPSPSPYRYKLTGLDAWGRNISLEESFPLRISADINGSSFSLEGTVNPSSLQGEARIRVSGLDVAAFAPYFQEGFPGRLNSLKLELDLTAEGDPRKVISSGQVTLKEIDMVLEALKESPIRDTRLDLAYALEADLEKSDLRIGKADAKLNGISVNLSGTVKEYSTDPKVDLVLNVPDLELTSAIVALPQGLVKDLEGMNVAGKVNARFNLSGSVAQPLGILQNGEVRLDALQATAGGLRPALSGLVTLKGDSVAAEKLQLKVGENLATLDISAKNLFGKPINLVSGITAERFLLDPLLKTAAAPVAAANEAKEEKTPAKTEMGPFDLPLEVSGTVRVQQALYQGLAINDFDVRYGLKNNVLTIEKLSGAVAGGSFQNQATVDLGKKGLVYAAEIDLQKIQADPLVATFVPRAAGTIFGSLSMNGSFSGSGTQPEKARNNLSGKGTLLLADGRLTGGGLVRSFSDFLDLEELRELKFSKINGSYTLRNGKVVMDGAIDGKEVRMTPQGTVGLDGSLDVTLDARLSPPLTQKIDRKGNVSQFLKDEQGWGMVPLKLGGTVTSPRFGLDTSVVKKKVQEKAREEIQKKVQEKVLEKLGPSREEGGTEQPARKMLEDTFKKLLGN